MLALSFSDRMHLAAGADQEIARALRGEAGALPPASRAEALGMLISEALPTAADAWGHLLAHREILVQLFGAFTFSAPQVEFSDRWGTGRRGDLGDALVIVDDLTGQCPDRRAVLIHSRMVSRSGVRQEQIGSTERELFETWPAFCFVSSVATQSPWNMRNPTAPGKAEECGLFAGIDVGPPSVNLQRSAGGSPAKSMTLGRLLVAMAVGKAGRKAIPAGCDPWSRTVDDVLLATLQVTTQGLGDDRVDVRTITRHSGESGTGFVVFDTGRDISPNAVEAQTRANGPLPVIHLAFKTTAEATARREPASSNPRTARSLGSRRMGSSPTRRRPNRLAAHARRESYRHAL